MNFTLRIALQLMVERRSSMYARKLVVERHSDMLQGCRSMRNPMVAFVSKFYFSFLVLQCVVCECNEIMQIHMNTLFFASK